MHEDGVLGGNGARAVPARREKDCGLPAVLGTEPSPAPYSAAEHLRKCTSNSALRACRTRKPRQPRATSVCRSPQTAFFGRCAGDSPAASTFKRKPLCNGVLDRAQAPRPRAKPGSGLSRAWPPVHGRGIQVSQKRSPKGAQTAQRSIQKRASAMSCASSWSSSSTGAFPRTCSARPATPCPFAPLCGRANRDVAHNLSAARRAGLRRA